MRSFIYCRVSTREQSTEDHYSLDNQEQRCHDYIKMKKWRVAKVCKDVASGKNDDRAGFNELLSDIRLQKIDVVTVYRLDHLSRTCEIFTNFWKQLKNQALGLLALLRALIQRLRWGGLMRRAEAGFFVGNLRQLYGYNYSKGSGLTPNPEESAQVKQIFDWYTEHKWGPPKDCSNAQFARGAN